jgi:hypothetical protein
VALGILSSIVPTRVSHRRVRYPLRKRVIRSAAWRAGHLGNRPRNRICRLCLPSGPARASARPVSSQAAARPRLDSGWVVTTGRTPRRGRARGTPGRRGPERESCARGRLRERGLGPDYDSPAGEIPPWETPICRRAQMIYRRPRVPKHRRLAVRRGLARRCPLRPYDEPEPPLLPDRRRRLRARFDAVVISASHLDCMN